MKKVKGTLPLDEEKEDSEEEEGRTQHLGQQKERTNSAASVNSLQPPATRLDEADESRAVADDRRSQHGPYWMLGCAVKFLGIPSYKAKH